MKKSWKSALSLLFVLVFMLQIAGMTASADTDPSVTGNEPLSIAVYIPAVNADGYEVSARMDGESVNLPEGKSLSMTLGGSELGYWSTITLADLMNSDLTITPPEGYYVAEAYIYASELVPGQSPASLEGTADYPSTTGTRVTLKSANFADEFDPWSFDSARLSNIGGSYTLLIRLDLLEKISYVTVSYSSGEAYANVPPAEGGSFGTSFTVQPMFESVPGKRFTGWQLTYGSGSVVDVSTGSQIQPYADCTLVAQWEDEEAAVEPVPDDPFVPVEPVPDDPFLPVEPSVHEHSWYESSVTPATCETDGVRYLTCSECNETTSEVIPATGHSYYETVVPPTYEAEGYTEHTCVNCGASYRDTYVPKLEHVHSYVEQITQNATCTVPGVKTFTCECGDSYTEEIPAAGHSYTDTVVAPTYEAEGYTEHVCSVCGDSYRDSFVPKLEHTHSYTEQVTQEPTCTVPGVKTFTCECGDTYTEEIPAIGHSYTEQVTQEPTCTVPGIKTFTCANCGDTYTQEIPMADHDYEVTVIDVTDFYKEHFSGCPNETAYCSPYTLIRLFADLIPEIPDKLLYLDADIMFNRDVHLLYDTDISAVEYAACPDHYGKYLIQPHYINAGVLLFNMKKARETGLFEKARGWIKKKKLVFADQSALIRSTSKKKVLPQRYNDQKFLHKHTVVRHFSKRLFYLPYPHTENIKQWQIDKVHKKFRYHQFDDIYQEYGTILANYEEYLNG